MAKELNEALANEKPNCDVIICTPFIHLASVTPLVEMCIRDSIIALLILVGFTPPEPSEEGGVPVMLGEVPDALGAADPSLVKVDVMRCV